MQECPKNRNTKSLPQNYQNERILHFKIREGKKKYII